MSTARRVDRSVPGAYPERHTRSLPAVRDFAQTRCAGETRAACVARRQPAAFCARTGRLRAGPYTSDCDSVTPLNRCSRPRRRLVPIEQGHRLMRPGYWQLQPAHGRLQAGHIELQPASWCVWPAHFRRRGVAARLHVANRVSLPARFAETHRTHAFAACTPRIDRPHPAGDASDTGGVRPADGCVQVAERWMRSAFRRVPVCMPACPGLHLDVSGLHLDVSGLHLDVSGLHPEECGLHLAACGLHLGVSGLHLRVSGLHLPCVRPESRCVRPASGSRRPSSNVSHGHSLLWRGPSSPRSGAAGSAGRIAGATLR
jgi:hypothetical protein